MNKYFFLFLIFCINGCTGTHLNRESSNIAIHKLSYQNVTDFNKTKSVNLQNNINFKTIENYTYHIGIGDILNIIVYDHPELTTPAGSFRSASESGNVVHSDGYIFYPYIGKIKVAGMTVNDLRNIISERLGEYIEKPQVDISIAAYNSQKVYITGEVNNPSLLPITNVPLTVIDAINQAGGITENADWNHITITRGEDIIKVSLKDLMQSGIVSNNILLESKDILHVSNNDGQKIFVLGEVIKPSVVTIGRSGISLTEAISNVGGVNKLSSDTTGIFVLRHNQSEKQIAEVFQLDISDASNFIIGNKFKLQPQDIVYVTATPISRWNRTINNLLSSIIGFNQISEGIKRIKDW